MQEANVSLAVVVLFPVVFYLPKFFEYRYGEVIQTVPTEMNCTEYALGIVNVSFKELFQISVNFLFPCGVRTQGYGLKIRCCCLGTPFCCLVERNW